MIRIFQRLAVMAFFLAATLSVVPARAQGPDPAVTTVQGFYDALVASMKAGGTVKSRYDKLKPAIDQAFDIPGMTAVAIGPTWASLSAPDQKALTDAFDRMTVANYAKNFDSFHGDKFTVDPTPVVRGAEKLVKSSYQPGSGDAIAFNYRMHQASGDWKVADVYLAGNISQMAQKRSDFSSTLSSGGPQGLAKKINALADQTLN